jgi:hypothetical protein
MSAGTALEVGLVNMGLIGRLSDPLELGDNLVPVFA